MRQILLQRVQSCACKIWRNAQVTGEFQRRPRIHRLSLSLH